MTATELTNTQKAIINDLANGWQQKSAKAIEKAVPGSEADITALVRSGHLVRETVSQQRDFFSVSTEVYKLTTEGERVADTLQGRNSTKIEQAVINRVLLAVSEKADKTLARASITTTEVGPERLGFLLRKMAVDGLLTSQRITRGFFSHAACQSHAAYQLTVAGERAVDVLAGRNPAECEQNAAAAILKRLEDKPDGLTTASLAGTGGLGSARLAAAFDGLAQKGQVEEIRIRQGNCFSSPGVRLNGPSCTSYAT